MNAIELLINRRSEKKLTHPAPNSTQLDLIFQAALRAPDHGHLQPYRFVVIEKEGLERFSQLLQSAVIEFNLGEERLIKAQNLATRAPMIIAVVAKINKDIKKVPAWEQMLTAGCATYAMQLAAKAQGFDNVWISGPWIDGNALRQALNCQQEDKIVAFLMLGTAAEKIEREQRNISTTELVSYL